MEIKSKTTESIVTMNMFQFTSQKNLETIENPRPLNTSFFFIQEEMKNENNSHQEHLRTIPGGPRWEVATSAPRLTVWPRASEALCKARSSQVASSPSSAGGQTKRKTLHRTDYIYWKTENVPRKEGPTEGPLLSEWIFKRRNLIIASVLLAGQKRCGPAYCGGFNCADYM